MHASLFTDTISFCRSIPFLHRIRHVRPRQIPRPVGALLQRLSRHHLRDRQQRTSSARSRQGRAAAAPAASRHRQPQDSDPLLCQQDGLQGRLEQRQDSRGSRAGQDHGQALAYIGKQRAERRRLAGGRRVADTANQGAAGRKSPVRL